MGIPRWHTGDPEDAVGSQFLVLFVATGCAAKGDKQPDTRAWLNHWNYLLLIADLRPRPPVAQPRVNTLASKKHTRQNLPTFAVDPR